MSFLLLYPLFLLIARIKSEYFYPLYPLWVSAPPQALGGARKGDKYCVSSRFILDFYPLYPLYPKKTFLRPFNGLSRDAPFFLNDFLTM